MTSVDDFAGKYWPCHVGHLCCAAYLQGWQRPKLQGGDAFPEGLILHCQQCDVAVRANSQHLRQKLLIVRSPFHFHLHSAQEALNVSDPVISLWSPTACMHLVQCS